MARRADGQYHTLSNVVEIVLEQADVLKNTHKDEEASEFLQDFANAVIGSSERLEKGESPAWDMDTRDKILNGMQILDRYMDGHNWRPWGPDLGKEICWVAIGHCGVSGRDFYGLSSGADRGIQDTEGSSRLHVHCGCGWQC